MGVDACRLDRAVARRAGAREFTGPFANSGSKRYGSAWIA